MRHLILIAFLTFGIATGFAQLPIKVPTRPSKTAPAAKPRPTVKPKPTRRTSSTGRTSSVPSSSVPVSQAIDLGLSVKWASHNVGANSPEEYGNYYGWADPSGNKTSKDVNDYPSANPPSNICGTSYDMVRQNWGGSWRLPSVDEWQELVDNCTYKVARVNGVKGMKFTSKRNGNSIFLPFAGNCWDTGVSGQDLWGYYWSGTLGEGDSGYAYGLSVATDGGAYPLSRFGRRSGQSVRPVTP